MLTSEVVCSIRCQGGADNATTKKKFKKKFRKSSADKLEYL